MFTGLIADLGSVAALEEDDAGATLRIDTRLAEELSAGDSIAVDGVCLTATEIHDGSFQAEAMNETLTRSALGTLAVGAQVNLELALRAADRLGGHLVQGHVDGIGTVSAVNEEGFSRVLRIEADQGLERYMVEKGSVTLNGVSLTISALHGHEFSVALIPETLKRTNLGQAAPGTQLNIEVDILAKHVERLILRS